LIFQHVNKRFPICDPSNSLGHHCRVHHQIVDNHLTFASAGSIGAKDFDLFCNFSFLRLAVKKHCVLTPIIEQVTRAANSLRPLRDGALERQIFLHPSCGAKEQRRPTGEAAPHIGSLHRVDDQLPHDIVVVVLLFDA
jgi:hypothetical protein